MQWIRYLTLQGIFSRQDDLHEELCPLTLTVKIKPIYLKTMEQNQMSSFISGKYSYMYFQKVTIILTMSPWIQIT